jgi:hypothetical protein
MTDHPTGDLLVKFCQLARSRRFPRPGWGDCGDPHTLREGALFSSPADRQNILVVVIKILTSQTLAAAAGWVFFFTITEKIKQ